MRARNREEHRARLRARKGLREAALEARSQRGRPAAAAAPSGPAANFDQAKHPRGRGGKWAQGAGAPAAAPARGGAASVPAKNARSAASGPAAQGGLPEPLFRAQDPKLYAAAFQRNRDFAEPGPFQTELSPAQETKFRTWLEKNQVPFNPQAQITDYDMRGYWKANQDADLPKKEFPHTFKTPYDPMFSKESRYATEDCPFVWKGKALTDQRNGQVIFR